MKTKEILIVRSTVSKLLYDVIEVDFMNEDLVYIEKNLSFVDAQALLAELTEETV